MNAIANLVLITLLLAIAVTVLLMYGVHLVFKNRYPQRMLEWYSKSLDKQWFFTLNVVLLIMLIFTFWYIFCRLTLAP